MPPGPCPPLQVNESPSAPDSQPPGPDSGILDSEPAHVDASVEQSPTLSHIGRYALKGPLGQGGLGQVHEAWDPLLSRTVAVKTLQFDIDMTERVSLDGLFLNEARAAAGLNHPHIVTIHDAGLSTQGVYIAMERLHGRDLRQALAAGIACFNVESEAELEVLNQVAVAAGARAPVSIRVNPNVDPMTHPYISTGLKGSKFGVAHERTLHTYRRAASLAGLRVVGIDCHIGSQITQEAPYLDAMDRMLDLVESVEAAGIAIEHIDFGGGLGIDYNGDQPPGADTLWPKLLAKLDARGFGQRRLMIEPGRSLVGNAGVCVTEVLYLKPGEQKNFCIVDAAMNDLPRPAMYQAYHGIVPLRLRADTATSIWEVVGPVCESGDWLGHARSLSLLGGDLLAVLSAGAYCMSMASNYNSRGRAAEVLVSGTAARLIRRRETIQDQLLAEQDADAG